MPHFVIHAPDAPCGLDSPDEEFDIPAPVPDPVLVGAADLFEKYPELAAAFPDVYADCIRLGYMPAPAALQ